MPRTRIFLLVALAATSCQSSNLQPSDTDANAEQLAQGLLRTGDTVSSLAVVGIDDALSPFTYATGLSAPQGEQSFADHASLEELSVATAFVPPFAEAFVASGLHKDAQAMFDKADAAYFKATKKHLSIESGTRTVQRQADLYICWKLGESGCNPADIPGASIHNYGYALDIRNARDPKVIKALGDAGWERTVMPKEPWHWEAKSASGWAATRKKRQEMRKSGSIARQWQSAWHAAKDTNDKRNKVVEELRTRAATWQPQWDQLRTDVQRFEQDVQQHNTRISAFERDRKSFNSRVDAHNREVESLQRLRARIESMSPSDERNRLIREYNRRAGDAASEQKALKRLGDQLRSRVTQLKREASDLKQRDTQIRQRYATLDGERQALIALSKNADDLKATIEAHMAKANKLLAKIATQVNP